MTIETRDHGDAVLPPLEGARRPIDAVTFDFWNTLMFEPPDGLVTERLAVLERILLATGLPVDRDTLRRCHEAAFAGYQRAWIANQQYCVPDAVDTILAGLGVAPTPALCDALIEGFSEAGRVTQLALADGVDECLRALRAGGVRLAIICDIGLTPSPVLRWHLEQRGLLDLFDCLVFSDETHVYKPDPAAFRAALEPLGVLPERAAHVGDRKRTDVAGALRVGMTAIRYVGTYDDVATPEPEAHHVIRHYQELVSLVLSVSDR